MNGGNSITNAQNLNVHLSGKVISACFALASFAVAILAGLASDNPASSVLARALMAMMICYPVGLAIGLICERLIIAHIAAHQLANPVAESVKSDKQPIESKPGDEEPIVV